MDAIYTLKKTSWNSLLEKLLDDFSIYAPFQLEDQIHYSIVTINSIEDIVYNRPKPSSPLKTFYLPIKENVVKPDFTSQKRIIIGPPACDLSGLSILDEIYLDKDYIDPNYSHHRENTILIGFDCHSINEHCHCTTYGYQPYPTENADLVLSLIDDKIILNAHSEKGKSFRENYITAYEQTTIDEKSRLDKIRKETEEKLQAKNQDLPGYDKTGELITSSEEEIWKRYSDDCVSCGACSAICPTCSCFLFIERPEFEKVRSIDTCQYPGFERVAAGEDPLHPLAKRFRNRYMCKYVWKPEKFKSKACTGCGRCIEACIGEISKNDIFRELNKAATTIKL